MDRCSTKEWTAGSEGDGLCSKPDSRGPTSGPSKTKDSNSRPYHSCSTNLERESYSLESLRAHTLCLCSMVIEMSEDDDLPLN